MEYAGRIDALNRASGAVEMKKFVSAILLASAIGSSNLTAIVLT